MHAAIVVWAALTAAAPAAAGQQPNASTSAEKEVRQVIADYNAAYGRNDLDTYFSYFAPDLTQWYPSGRVNLAAYRESWTKSVKEGNVMEKVEVMDLQIQVDQSGDAAIATYVLRTTSRDTKGVSTTSDNHETDVLFQRDGQWKIVHIHYSPVRPRRQGP